MAAMLSAAQWGLPLMTVINGCHNIKGKVSPSADLMAAIVRRHVDGWTEGELENPTGYFVEGTRRSDGMHLRVTFTVDDAKRAKLGGDNWQNFPADMCRARAITRFCRRIASDVLAGVYSPEELEDAELRRPLDSGAAGQTEPQEQSDHETIKHLLGLLAGCLEIPNPDNADIARKAVNKEFNEAMRDGRIRKDGTCHARYVKRHAEVLEYIKDLKQKAPEPAPAADADVIDAEFADASPNEVSDIPEGLEEQ
jgi:hypothetical protein